ncbi:MAG TPA: hypothetical protein VFQ79_09210 [Bryobacteraceae bacterium]|nr:hypothetical protein [Bryobacteraceae bacterium]
MAIHRLVRPQFAAGAEALVCVDGTRGVNKIRIQAPVTNSGRIYLGDAADMTPETAWGELPPGYTEWLGDESYGNVLDVGAVYVLRETDGDQIRGAAFTR